jgi:hypothetical protein
MSTFILKPEQSPKQEVDLRERLCWVQYDKDDETYLWPAVWFFDYAELQCHLQDSLDNEAKTQIGIRIMDNAFSGKEVMVARLLGRGAEFVEISQNHGYLLFSDHAQQAAETMIHPKAFTEHIDLYLNYMEAFDESYKILTGVGETKWRQLGEQRLEEFKKPQPEPATEKLSAEKTSAKEPATEELVAEPQPMQEDEEHQALQETPPNSNKRTADELFTTWESSPTRSTTHASSSATVVSTDTPEKEDHGSSPKKLIFEIKASDTFKEVFENLQYVGNWYNRKVETEVLYFPPEVIEEDKRDRGVNCFDKAELCEYLMQTYQWKEPEIETAKEKLPTREAKPRRGRPAKKETPKSKSKAVVTPKRRSARTPMVKDESKPASPQGEKKIEQEKEDVYNFKCLIEWLTWKLGWKYKTTSPRELKYYYVYERGGTDGRKGVYLKDYFHEEQDVIDYCKEHNYKERAHELEEEYAARKDSEDQTQSAKVGTNPGCVTPPTKRQRRAMQA